MAIGCRRARFFGGASSSELFCSPGSPSSDEYQIRYVICADQMSSPKYMDEYSLQFFITPGVVSHSGNVSINVGRPKVPGNSYLEDYRWVRELCDLLYMVSLRRIRYHFWWIDMCCHDDHLHPQLSFHLLGKFLNVSAAIFISHARSGQIRSFVHN